MHLIRCAILFGVAVFGIAASPTLKKRQDVFASYFDYQDIETPPYPWKYVRPAPENHLIDIRIALKLQNQEIFHQRLIDMSTPGHAIYGQHMGNEELDAMIKPKDDSIQFALDWLESFGVRGSYENHYVKATISIAKAQELLQTKYAIYSNHQTGQMVVRTLSYRLPKIMSSHIDFVQPTTAFSMMRPQLSNIRKWRVVDSADKGDTSGDCSKSANITCVQKQYNMAGFKHGGRSKVGVAGFLDQFANREDYRMFFKKFKPQEPISDYTVVSVNGGGDDQSKPGSEANLDIQYVAGLTTPSSTIYYSVGGSPPFKPDQAVKSNTNEPYLDFVEYLYQMETKGQKIPDTLSISYGDDEQTVPQDYAKRICDEFAKLGAKGISILVSSGDFGVGQGSCESNDGTKRIQFQPTFPASCPFVTAVGATNGTTPERAVDFSGGGFSRYFDRPAYQNNDVDHYLQNLGKQSNGFFNRLGRAFPDVAAYGENCRIFLEGKEVSISGTSCSAPIFASVISLINDNRFKINKPPLGFLNPILYGKARDGLNDITTGSNPACGAPGFKTDIGWDPVSGLGTPDLKKLMNILGVQEPGISIKLP